MTRKQPPKKRTHDVRISRRLRDDMPIHGVEVIPRKVLKTLRELAQKQSMTQQEYNTMVVVFTAIYGLYQWRKVMNRFPIPGLTQMIQAEDIPRGGP